MVPHEEKEAPTIFVNGCREMPCDMTSTHVFSQKDIEETLAMRYVDEYIPFELSSKGDYLFKDLVDKYITEMEDQGCTKLTCIGRELFDMHDLKERPHEPPIWNEYLVLKKVVDC